MNSAPVVPLIQFDRLCERCTRILCFRKLKVGTYATVDVLARGRLWFTSWFVSGLQISHDFPRVSYLSCMFAGSEKAQNGTRAGSAGR